MNRYNQKEQIMKFDKLEELLTTVFDTCNVVALRGSIEEPLEVNHTKFDKGELRVILSNDEIPAKRLPKECVVLYVPCFVTVTSGFIKLERVSEGVIQTLKFSPKL